MKFHKIKIWTLGVIAALALNSCKDEDFGEDYNQNTYGIYESDYKSLMTGAISQLALRGGTNFHMKPILYSQYLAQNVYTTESQYAQVGGQWDWYYARALLNLDRIIIAYSADNLSPDLLSQGSKGNMLGISKIFRAIIYKRITDAYGNIPYSEANQYETIRTPKFDSQQAVYESIIADLKAGRDLLDSGTLAKGDVLYGGNVAMWRRLANSVILQASLQLSKKYPGASDYAATEFKAALANSGGVIETVGQEAWYTYNSDAGITNPNYGFRAADYRLSRELVESLRGTTTNFNRTSNHTLDMRLRVFNNGFSTASAIVGLPYGYSAPGLADAGYTAPPSSNGLGVKFRSITSPMSLMTAGYTYLNRAEAAARGWTTENAAALLKQGIVLNYNTLDAHYITNTNAYSASTNIYGGVLISPEAEAYSTARVADVAAAAGGVLQVIGEEKWVALFNNGFDSWAEWRRTGFPNLLPAPNSLNGGVIPRRIMYPTNEQIFNATNYTQALTGLSPAQDLNTSKVWWDQ